MHVFGRPCTRSRRFLSKRAIVTATAVASLLALLPADPAAAQGLDLDVAPASHNTDADPIWDVATPDENVRHTGRQRPLVFDIEERNGRVYVGGKYLELIAPDGTIHARPYLAAFDVDTGDWIPSFQPQLDGAVYSMDFTDDGRLLVGGELTGGIAAVDPVTGAIDQSFDPGITNSWGTPAIFDLEVSQGSVYAGGRFARAQGVDLANLIKIDATTGTIDPAWVPTTQLDLSTPRLGGQLVYGLAVDEGRQRVYVVGKFGSINDDGSAAYFGTLDLDNGVLRNDVPQGLPPNTLSHRESFSMWQHDVQFRGDQVYIGGQGHQTLILNANDLSPTHSFFTNRGVGDAAAGGDTQVIFLGENTLWAGCQCWGSVGPYPLGSYNGDNPDGHQSYAEYRQWVVDFRDVNPFGQQRVYGAYGIDLETQRLSAQTFDLSGQAGAWALLEDSNGRLWLGGQFRPRGGRSWSGLVRFSPTVEVEPLTPVETCTATHEDRTVTVLWPPATGAESYVVRRSVDGGDTRHWRGRTSELSFVDSDRANQLGYWIEAKAQGQSVTATACERVIVQPEPDPVLGLVPSCRVSLVGDDVTVDWDAADNADSYVVYRTVDGAGPFWRGRTDTFSFVDTWRNAQLTYSVAAKGGNERTDAVTCTG